MRNLLWKDFRQNGKVLLAVGIVAAIPYAVVFGMMAAEMLVHPSNSTTPPGSRSQLTEAIEGCSYWSLGLSIVMAAFIGGNAIAGERADRSAEFAAGLPIPRGKAVVSKATVAAASCLAMWTINAAVWLIGWQVDVHTGAEVHYAREEVLVLPLCLMGIVVLFSLGWLYSSLLRSPAIAAAAALGTALGFVVAVDVLGPPVYGGLFFTWFPILVMIISVLCFAAGAEISRRRVEP